MRWGIVGVLTTLMVLTNCSPYQTLKPRAGADNPATLLGSEDLGKRFRVVLKDGTVDWGALASFDETTLTLQSRKYRGKVQLYRYRDIERIEKYQPFRRGTVIAGVLFIGALCLLIKVGRAFGEGFGQVGY